MVLLFILDFCYSENANCVLELGFSKVPNLLKRILVETFPFVFLCSVTFNMLMKGSRWDL